MRAQLVPADGSQPIDIVKDLTVLGRKEDCDVCVKHKSVSKMHCVIVKTDGLLMLRDLGSTNGTRVNGQRVRRAALLPNDELTIAGFKFRVMWSAAEPAVSPDSPTEHLEPKELNELAKKLGSAPRLAKPAAEPVRPNQLPDLYSDDPNGHTERSAK
jgi:pSer/pThr/pTyr-binding forkhead associated (FHA) protein